ARFASKRWNGGGQIALTSHNSLKLPATVLMHHFCTNRYTASWVNNTCISSGISLSNDIVSLVTG
ncbi:MAG: hypothetical protein JWL66_946, partial [Sphingomonadales bacterium]|nr:hypothetical protein [Sphingomonadales bacterium]